MKTDRWFILIVVWLSLPCLAGAQDNQPSVLAEQVSDTLNRAATSYARLAVHGGYVYYHIPQRSIRLGEGPATETEIWVQPPGTPTVGMAFLSAYRATGDRQYLDFAMAAGQALLHGQLESGGWTNQIDFDPAGERVGRYRHGKGRAKGRNVSTLDDSITASAVQFLIQLDEACEFRNSAIHEATKFALDAVLRAQFPNGGFPQGWDGPVDQDWPVISARYPDHDWRTEGRIKNYWDMYTLNDDVPGSVLEMLVEADRVYRDDRFVIAIRKLGDFLILAQMPPPQQAWAQQYNSHMEPIWARRFEPAAIASDETQEAIETLIGIAQVTANPKYLEPIPAALNWIKDSELPDGQLARFYELRTNKPLYMTRRGKEYELTYEDRNLPDHYAFKVKSRHETLKRKYEKTLARPGSASSSTRVDDSEVRRIIEQLDENGFWVSRHSDKKLTGQPDFGEDETYLSSKVFSENVETLSQWLTQNRLDEK